jgi:hypothetical protein
VTVTETASKWGGAMWLALTSSFGHLSRMWTTSTLPIVRSPFPGSDANQVRQKSLKRVGDNSV